MTKIPRKQKNGDGVDPFSVERIRVARNLESLCKSWEVSYNDVAFWATDIARAHSQTFRLDYRYILRLARGDVNFPNDKLTAVALVFGLSVRDLYSSKPPRGKDPRKRL